ncbi:hypothetical protein V9T40_003881 [Parthenolecanium corni]|uniref:Histone acetyltransferase type B catalytic subunit n=1 Tax=Parthenolecanium corni TaxID=536013 RepID=A0AAN9TDW5_9HEMI
MNEVDNSILSAFEDNDIERRFVADCNEVIHFKLVRSQDDIESEEVEFQPEMSHQVFGKTEKIFGYNDLKIDMYYTAGWLRTYINISFKEKIDPSVIGLPADNVIEILSKFLEHDYFENIDLFVNSLKEESKFKPSGSLIDSISVNENGCKNIYEVYHVHVSNTDNNFFEGYYQRLQRFLIWYIDGASFVDVDDDRWNYFIMYEKYTTKENESAYAVTGLTTVYEYYAYPNNKRPRISQMLILPPFQNQGLAVHLMNSMYKFYSTDKNVIDITVEDPTDGCQAIRDFIDLCRCENLPCFSNENLKKGYKKEIENELREKFQIHKKQARRIYEILLLRTINKANEEEYKNYRIQVKNRLNAPFQKMNSTMRRMNYTFKPDEVKEVAVLQKPEVRFNTLKNLYDELEKQYEHVLERFENRAVSV